MNTHHNPLQSMIEALARNAYLSEADREALLALPYKLRTLEAQSYTIREGDPPEQCYVLVSGFAYRQKMTGEGARQIVAIHIPGEALDFQNLYLDVADHSVQMLTRGEVAMIPRADLRQLAQARPAIAHAILIAILIEASIFREWVLNVGRRDARTRLAHVLCEFGARLQSAGLAGDNGFELPMTQEQLADVLGLTPVHVNRTIKLLEADGLLQRNRRMLSFPDWKALRDVGDFNTRYLHLQQQD